MKELSGSDDQRFCTREEHDVARGWFLKTFKGQTVPKKQISNRGEISSLEKRVKIIAQAYAKHPDLGLETGSSCTTREEKEGNETTQG